MMNIQSINTSSLAGPPPTPTRQTPPAGETGSPPQVAVQPTPDAARSGQANVSADQLESAVKATNDFVHMFNNSVQFNVDEDTGKTVVKLIDKETKEVVRQIPSEEMLAIAKALDSIKGLLVRQKA